MPIAGLAAGDEPVELKAGRLLAEPQLGSLVHEPLEIFEGEAEDGLEKASVFVPQE